MLKTPMAACLIATTFVAVPALAQTSAPATNPPALNNQAPAAARMSGPNVNAAEFVNQAANSDMFEIQSSQLALTKTQENRIRDFAQHMIQDHTAASDKLKAAAKDQTVPANLDQEHTQMLQQLQQVAGNDFNRSYVQMQFNGHQKAVALFEAYAQNGDNAQLKQLAQETVPTLREHLQQITQIRSTLFAPARVGQNEPGQTGQQFMTQEQPGQWRASKLRGLNIYNSNNEKIGDVNELIVDNSGTIQAAIVGVGGFLGVGERDVAIPFDQIKFANEPRAPAPTGATGTTGTTAGTTAPSGTVAAPASPNAPATATAPATPTAPATTGAVPADQTVAGAAARSGPDHGVLTMNMTKDQLRAVPEFKYAR
jgi:predicted outer membrane protein/sporulation protein YlmC with PRC-barrel domain